MCIHMCYKWYLSETVVYNSVGCILSVYTRILHLWLGGVFLTLMDFTAWCSGGRRPLIAGRGTLQRVVMVPSLVRRAGIGVNIYSVCFGTCAGGGFIGVVSTNMLLQAASVLQQCCLPSCFKQHPVVWNHPLWNNPVRKSRMLPLSSN